MPDRITVTPSPHAATTDRPIFIVGCPRSGTTMLQLMLHAHPDIAIPPETRFLLEAYDRREQFGDLGERSNRRRLAKFITRRRGKLRDLGLDRAVVRRRIVRGPPTVGAAARVVFRSYSRRFGKRRWGDKRPSYVQRLDVLLRLFPDAQIIHIIRDGRDCASSLKRMPWWNGGTVGAVWTWRNAVISGRRIRSRVAADTYTEVRYEDLIAEPERELRRLCAFLGEHFDDRMLAPHRVAEVAVPSRKVWHTRTHVAVDDSALQRWRSDLDGWERDLFHLVAGRQLKAAGYTPHRPERLPPIGVLVGYARYHIRREVYQRYRRARDRVRQWQYGQAVAALSSEAAEGSVHTYDRHGGALR